jgi:hypothetical protein
MANININDTLARKLHPGRFPGMSSRMAAIVGCILDRQYTQPSIAQLVITSDNCVLARHDDDIGYNDFIGARSDLERNWKRLLDVAGLTNDERQLAKRKYRQHITSL